MVIKQSFYIMITFKKCIGAIVNFIGLFKDINESTFHMW